MYFTFKDKMISPPTNYSASRGKCMNWNWWSITPGKVSNLLFQKHIPISPIVIKETIEPIAEAPTLLHIVKTIPFSPVALPEKNSGTSETTISSDSDNERTKHRFSPFSFHEVDLRSIGNGSGCPDFSLKRISCSPLSGKDREGIESMTTELSDQMPKIELKEKDMEFYEDCFEQFNSISDEAIAKELSKLFDILDEHEVFAHMLAEGAPLEVFDSTVDPLEPIALPEMSYQQDRLKTSTNDTLDLTVLSSKGLPSNVEDTSDDQVVAKVESTKPLPKVKKAKNQQRLVDSVEIKTSPITSSKSIMGIETTKVCDKLDDDKMLLMRTNQEGKPTVSLYQSKKISSPSVNATTEMVGLESKEMYTIYRMIEYLKIVKTKKNHTLLCILLDAKEECYRLHKKGFKKYRNLPAAIFDKMVHEMKGHDFVTLFIGAKTYSHPILHKLRKIEEQLHYRSDYDEIKHFVCPYGV